MRVNEVASINEIGRSHDGAQKPREVVANFRRHACNDGDDAVNFQYLSRQEAQQRINLSAEPHYVYVLATPKVVPFYVGKGSGNRVFQHEAEVRNAAKPSHKRNVIRKIIREGGTVAYAFAGFYADEQRALAEEVRLIAAIGRHDLGRGPLTNQTDGGEGAVNLSEESRLRRLATLGGESDDPERRAINEFFAGISGPQSSVPIKPLATWRNARPLHWTARKYGPTLRSARAIVATAVANEIILSPGTLLPRLLIVNGAEFLIENGCGDALIKSRLVKQSGASKVPRDEELELTPLGFEYVREQFGDRTLVGLGVLEP